MKKSKSYNQGAIGTIVIFGVIAFIGAATLIGTNLVKDKQTVKTKAMIPDHAEDPTTQGDPLPPSNGECVGDCEPSCFPAGTKITMSDGTKKNIEEVKVGDSILSFDKGQKLQSAIVYEMESPMREGYYNVLLDDKTVLKVTDEHPLYFKNPSSNEEGWASFSPEKTKQDSKMKVKQLTLGSLLKKEDGTWSRIVNIEYILGSVQTYNLKKVQGNSFFAEGIWAHNKSGDSNNSPTGHLDVVSCNLIEGWTCDLDNWARDSLPVHFYYDTTSKFLGSTIANTAREAGVCTACSGYCNHGFRFKTPDILRDGLSHKIYAYGINTVQNGVNTLLKNSPMTLRCSTCTVSVVKNANKITVSYTGRSNNTNIRLWLERIDYKAINGIQGLPAPTINPDNKNYYLLEQKKSTNYSLVSRSFDLPANLPNYDKYWVHCDTETGIDKCSGSPACKYEGVSGAGFYGCEGWSSCGNKDRATFAFVQSTPTPTLTPIPPRSEPVEPEAPYGLSYEVDYEPEDDFLSVDLCWEPSETTSSETKYMVRATDGITSPNYRGQNNCESWPTYFDSVAVCKETNDDCVEFDFPRSNRRITVDVNAYEQSFSDPSSEYIENIPIIPTQVPAQVPDPETLPPNVILNVGASIGRSCNTLCVSEGFSGCSSIGTNSGANNGEIYFQEGGRCRSIPSSDYNCNFSLQKGADGIHCPSSSSPLAPWTYCLCGPETPPPEDEPTVAPSCPKKAQGDANCDGAINNLDYQIILSALQGNDISDLCDDIEDCSADINGDGKVTIIDYTIWLNSYFNINSVT